MREAIGRLTGMVLSILVPAVCGLALYGLASEHEVQAFWQYTPGALMLYGGQPDARFRRAYASASAKARALGFAFADPQIIQANELLNLWYVRWRRSYVIAVSEDGKHLLIDGLWMVQFPDEDLECVMAHEVGHVIDFQRLSEEHPVILRTQCLDSQERADSIGRLLCGGERYDNILRRHIKTRPISRRSCNGADPVP